MTVYPLFALTTFLSSFLLFLVQPLLGKYILPWYGGSSAVWITAMLFFMVALAAGYVYALFLTRLPVFYQVVVHALGVALASAVLFRHTAEWSSAMTPPVDVFLALTSNPTVSVFLLLLLVVGLPFVLLSTTSTLLQYWYGRLSAKEPFALYGISNIGSLLGLLGYPFFLEPFLSIETQGTVFGVGFLLYVVVLLAVLVVVLRGVKREEVLPVARLPWRRFALATVLAAVPVATMLAGTSLMTTSVAPVPFLWVGPLALYLLSFVVTFRNGPRPPMFINEAFLVLAGLCTVILLLRSASITATVTILLTHLLVFSVFHWCHERLYLLRPDTAHLPMFYVALSLGGIVGSIAIKVSTYVLPLPVELLLIVFVCVAIVLRGWWSAEDGVVFRLTNSAARSVTAALGFLLILSGFIYVERMSDSRTFATRNFFGFKSIYEEVQADGVVLRSLTHGLTNHGYQVRIDDVPQILPVSYYGAGSGIGRAFAALQIERAKVDVAVAGLGGGGLAAYCRPGDTFSFLEIDPAVVEMAYEHFTYLAACPGHTVAVTDARLALTAKEPVGIMYDLVVLDAYADDMMPIHLMTTEALALYTKLLKPGGILAVHISSRYLALRPVLETSAAELGLAFRHHFEQEPTASYTVPSDWVLLAATEEVFLRPEFAGMNMPINDKNVLWTDSYSSLLPVVRW